MAGEEYSSGRPRRRSYTSGGQQTGRQSGRSRTSYSSDQVRRRQSDQGDYSQRRVQMPAAERATDQASSTRRSSSRRADAYAGRYASDDVLAEYTGRTAQYGAGRQDSRRTVSDESYEPRRRTAAPREQSTRQAAQRRTADQRPRRTPATPAQPSVLERILGVLAAIGTAIVNFFGWVGQLIPPLRRFSPGAVTAMAAVLVVAVFGVSFALGQGGTSEVPVSSEAAESAESAETEQQPTANATNPNEPADLVWRDSDFAVDPSFHSWSNKDNGRKTVYLTIDDGPSRLTEQYLDLFDKYNVKATFFVTGQNPEYYYLIREAYNRGHTIGLHSMTHDYTQIYSSEDAYFKDLDQIGQVVKEQLGYVPCFIRFPGGSSNTQAEGYSQGLMPKLVNSVQARGYQYYDWSLASGDGEDRSTSEIVSMSTDAGEPGYDPTKDMNIVLLCHDSATKQTTLEALPKIIEYYQAAGYTFEALDRTSWICHHEVYRPEPETTEEEDGYVEEYDETYDETYEEPYEEADYA